MTGRTKDASPAAVRKAGTMVAAIVEHHLGTPPKDLSAAGGGLTNHVFFAAQTRQLRTSNTSVPAASLQSRLNHGDMRPKNVLADEDGNVTAIIDWEDCLANPPLWDLSLALHDLSIDEKRVFLDGYGLDERELLAIAPAIRAVNLLNYVPTIRQALEDGDQAELAHLRLRLAGTYDLYGMPPAPRKSSAAGRGSAARRKVAEKPRPAGSSAGAGSQPAKASSKSPSARPRARA